MIDIFSTSVQNHIEERAGSLLAQKDLKEERHEKKKTDEDVFNDFLHNVEHPFMDVLVKEAAKYERSGDAFIIQKRIAVLIDDEDSDERYLYYNQGDTWRQSADALIGKYLKERFPDLYTPGMKFGCKGEQLLLDAYPDNFGWVREVYKKRAKNKEAKQ